MCVGGCVCGEVFVKHERKLRPVSLIWITPYLERRLGNESEESPTS